MVPIIARKWYLATVQESFTLNLTNSCNNINTENCYLFNYGTFRLSKYILFAPIVITEESTGYQDSLLAGP